MWGAVYIVILSGLTLASLKRGYFAFVAFLCLFGLEQWGMLYIPYLRSHPLLTNIAVFLVLALAIVIRPPSLNIKGANFKIRIWGVLLIGYAFISHLWAPPDASAVAKWNSAWPYLVSGLFLTTIVIKSIDDLELAYKWFVLIGGFLLVLFAFVPVWQNRHIIISGDYNIGTKLALPLTLAQLSGYVLITAVFSYKKKIVDTLIIGTILVSVFLVMLKSGSRGPMIFSILSIMFVAPYVLDKATVKKIFPFFIVFGIFSVILVVTYSAGDVFSGRWSMESMTGDLTGRYSNATRLLSKAYESPMTIMFGLGNSAAFSPRILGVYPHIVPLEILAEEGLLGFSIFCIFCYKVLSAGRLVLKSRLLNKQEKKVLAITFSCWLFTFLLSFKQGSLITSPNLFLFAAVFEKLYSLARVEAHKRESIS